jgi:small subunit ribosomal protein S16
MVVINLARCGTHNKPSFVIVVKDSHTQRDGRFIEKLGFYNPFIAKDIGMNINITRIQYWISVGAQPSACVKMLIKKWTKKSAQSIIKP